MTETGNSNTGDSKRAFLLALLDMLAGRDDIRLTYLWRLPNAERQGAAAQPWPRINIILGGAYEAETARKDGVSVHMAEEGEAMILPAFAYANPTLRFSYDFLSLVLRENYLRLVYHEIDAAARTFRPPLIEYHLEDTLQLATVHAFNSCVHAGEGAYDDGVRRRGFRYLLELARADLAVSKGVSHDKSYYTYQRVIRYIEEHYDEALSREAVGRKLKVSRSYFTKLFQRYSSVSMLEYQMTLRMRKAVELLGASGLDVSEIGYACGFQSTSFFIRNFKARFGVTPARYRQRLADSRG